MRLSAPIFAFAGYRAGLRRNAIVGSIDTRKTENCGLLGPYASISIELGIK